MSKRTKFIGGIVALGLAAGALSILATGCSGSGPEIETATVSEQQLAVIVTASGKVASGIRADVFPPTAGTLDTVDVSDGETVTAGQRIAQMDTGPLELQVAQAQAGLSQAKAQLANIGAQGVSSSDLRAARAQVKAAEAAYNSAKVAAGAVSDGGPSQAQIEAAEAATKAAKTAYDNAKAAYDAAVVLSPDPSVDPTVAVLAAQKDGAYAGYKGAQATEAQLKSTNLSVAQSQANAGVKQAYAAWQQAKAQLNKLEAADPASQRRAAQSGVAQASEALSVSQNALEEATLLAPIDGVVLFNAALSATGAGDKPAEGSPVSPQAAPFTVVDLGALKFSAEVDEADVERVKAGMKASVVLDSFPGEEFVTEVVRVNPAAQPTATGGTVFAVEMALTDTEKDILIGMKGDATIEVSSRAKALTIPVEALFSEGGTDYVYVVDAGKLTKSEITVGATTDTEVEVLEGLSQGQVVALSGATQYTDGMSVRTK